MNTIAMTSILRDLKQKRPFPSRTTEAAVALLHTADLMRRNIAAVLEPSGITPQQYNVLRILRGAGEEGLPTLEIGERMIEETPGITRLIDRLEQKQLVVRVRCETDRRQVFCHITREGLALLDRLEAPLAASETQALRGLKKRDLELLIDLLDRSREGLHQTLDTLRQQNGRTHRRT